MRQGLVVTGVFGVLGGLWWIAFSVLVTDDVMNTLGEDLANRLWSPGLASLFIGFVGFAALAWGDIRRVAKIALVGLTVGTALMFLGNAVEYWILFDLPHQGPGGLWRGIAWMTVLFGALVVLLALPISGITLSRSTLPLWVPWALGLTAPLAVALAFVSPRLAVLPIAVLALLLGVFQLTAAASGVVSRARD